MPKTFVLLFTGISRPLLASQNPLPPIVPRKQCNFYTDEHSTASNIPVSSESYVILSKYFGNADSLTKPWLCTCYNIGIICVSYIPKIQRLVKAAPAIDLHQHQWITLSLLGPSYFYTFVPCPLCSLTQPD
jgi:hypothetical protein